MAPISAISSWNDAVARRSAETRAVPMVSFVLSSLGFSPGNGARRRWCKAGAPIRLSVRDGAHVRADAALASVGASEGERAVRRVRGRPSGEWLGSSLRPFFRLTGAGEVWVAGTSNRWAALTLDEDILYVREDRVLAFDGSVSWEAGRIPGDGLRMLQFRGRGQVVLQLGGLPAAVAHHATTRRRGSRAARCWAGSGGSSHTGRGAKDPMPIVLRGGRRHAAGSPKELCLMANLRREFTNLPNLVTMGRVVLVPFVLLFIDNFSPLRSFIASLLYLGAAAGDALDGYLARSRGQVSMLGKFLDPLADKLIVTAVLVFMVGARACAGLGGRGAAGARLRDQRAAQRRLGAGAGHRRQRRRQDQDRAAAGGDHDAAHLLPIPGAGDVDRASTITGSGSTSFTSRWWRRCSRARSTCATSSRGDAPAARRGVIALEAAPLDPAEAARRAARGAIRSG